MYGRGRGSKGYYPLLPLMYGILHSAIASKLPNPLEAEHYVSVAPIHHSNSNVKQPPCLARFSHQDPQKIHSARPITISEINQ